jgi:hypothetical protein
MRYFITHNIELFLLNFLVIWSNVLMVTLNENKTESNLKLESEKEQLDLIEFDENMADMNLETLNLHGSSKQEDFITTDSFMIMFDEDILEDEISQGDMKPTHIPWTLIYGGSGGGLLVMVVGLVLVGVVRCRWNKRKNIYQVKEEMAGSLDAREQ